MSVQTIVIQVDARAPDAALVQRAASALKEGRLVVLPTDTVYGLCCSAFSQDAVNALYEAKGRPHSLPLVILIASAADVSRYASDFPLLAQRAASRWWPGPLTIVLPRAASVPGFLVAEKPTVGLRVPGHRVPLAVIQAGDFPIAATSANLSGQRSPANAWQVMQSLGGRAALLLDAGPCPVGRESTVVDFSKAPAVVLRESAVTLSELRSVLGYDSIRCI
jgi:L-threonylcarbamoyladenylate synthase